MKKIAVLALALLLAANVNAANKPRITGGNLPQIPSKPRWMSDPLPPQWVEWFVCGPRMPQYVRRYCQPV